MSAGCVSTRKAEYSDVGTTRLFLNAPLHISTSAAPAGATSHLHISLAEYFVEVGSRYLPDV